MLDAVRNHLAAVSPTLGWGLAGVGLLLTFGALAATLLPLLKPERDHSNLRARVWSWWVMAALLAGAILAGWQATTLLFVVVSFIALREYLSLAPMRPEDRPIMLLAYLAIPASYAFVAVNIYMFYLVFIPVWMFLVLPFAMALRGETGGFLGRVATFHWGLVTCVFNLGFAALLMRTPDAEAPAGAAGLVFFLIVFTEFNDVAQYVFGKLFGRRRVTPRVSPNKTWGGLLGGWISTAALIWFAGPLFTPLNGVGLAVAAVVLPLAGFAGDVTMSAVKRDLGVKDTSQLIPGHGGLLDRVDSLTFTAPVFFHLLAFFSLKAF